VSRGGLNGKEKNSDKGVRPVRSNPHPAGRQKPIGLGWEGSSIREMEKRGKSIGLSSAGSPGDTARRDWRNDTRSSPARNNTGWGPTEKFFQGKRGKTSPCAHCERMQQKSLKILKGGDGGGLEESKESGMED